MRYFSKIIPQLLLISTLLVPSVSSAEGEDIPYIEQVNGSIGVLNTNLLAMASSVETLLYDLGIAVNENGDKIANTVETSSRMSREFAAYQMQDGRNEDARQRYYVPDSICGESPSGGAYQVQAVTAGFKSNLRPGLIGSSATPSFPAVIKAVNLTHNASEDDMGVSGTVHKQFCDTQDYANFGGSSLCPAISTTMPGADTRFDSLMIGAGTNGKTPDLTFSEAQSEAAEMYVKNSVRRSVATPLNKGEAETTAGSQYLGLMDFYNSEISAAANPQEEFIADSQPNPQTQALITEAKNSPSFNSYFQQTASPQALNTGVMSEREFQEFEVGRRYSNTLYESDLQAMAGDNLVRELIRVQSLNNRLLLDVKNHIRESNMLSGIFVASAARQEYTPLLATQRQAIAGSLGGQ